MNEDVFIYPTDTVWGIGGNVLSQKVISNIHKIKDRDKDKPVSILFNSIDMLQGFFEIPENYMRNGWLEKFFQLETTALLPIEWMKKEIPKEIYHNSPFVGVRCLKTPWINQIIEKVQAPIITTSLNQAGDPAIINFSKAKSFQKEYAKEAVFIGEEGEELSGTPSSIVKFNNSKEIDFLREGINAKAIKEHMGLLST